MASKRKLEEDAENFATPSKAAKLAEEVTRSGRVRKKPARFQDTEEEMEEEASPGEAVKVAKSPASPMPKPMPSPKVAPVTPVIPKTDVSESPKAPKPKAAVPKSPGLKIVVQNPGQVAPSLPSVETSPVMPLVVSIPAPVVVPVVVPAPVTPTVQSPVAVQPKTAPPVITPQSVDIDNKSGRVRKKSTKVLEMEAFEEAERGKALAKKAAETKGTLKSPIARRISQTGVVGKAEDQGLTTVTLTGLSPGVAAEMSKLTSVKMEPAEQMLDTSIPPQALSQPAIHGKMDPALANLPPFPPSKLGASKAAGKLDPVLANLPPFPPSKLGSSAKKGKKKKDDLPIPAPPLIAPASPVPIVKKIKLTPKVKKAKQPDVLEADPMVTSGAVLSPGVKEEPDTVLQQSASSIDSAIKVKAEPVSPTKTIKKGTKGVPDQVDPSLIETGLRLPQSMSGQSGSVIKMLLNTPTQFSSPTVSTQSINSAEKVQKSGTSPEAMDHSIVKSEGVYMGDEPTLLLSSDIMEQTETVGDEDMFDKKKVKRVIKKTILMDPMDVDDEDDDLDDLDDEDDDDLDNVDESGEWEFENQDGKLVIADFPKKGAGDADEKHGAEAGKGKKSPKRPNPKKRTPSKGKGDGADTEYQIDTMPLVRKRYTMKEKIDVVQWHRKHGNNCSATERKFGISRKQVRMWNRDYVKLLCHSIGTDKMKKSFHTGLGPTSLELDKQIYEWFLDERMDGRDVTNTMLRDKARGISSQLCVDGFLASNGWLQRWKKRFCVGIIRPDTYCNDITKLPADYRYRKKASMILKKFGYLGRALSEINNSYATQSEQQLQVQRPEMGTTSFGTQHKQRQESDHEETTCSDFDSSTCSLLETAPTFTSINPWK